jgi:hypothetical protein
MTVEGTHALARRLLDRTEPQIVSELRDRLGLDPPDTLHHYTSPPGLLGILQSGHLWFTDALFLNDQSELSYGRNLVSEALRERIRISNEQLGTIFRYTLQNFETTPAPMGLRVRFYVASFCENDNLLSQWRAYSSAATGYSLGFDVKQLKLQEQHSDARQRVTLRRVEYCPETQQEMLGRIIDIFGANVCDEVPTAQAQSNRVLGECVSALVMLLWSLVPQLKDPAFEEEREWRLVYTSIQDKPLKSVLFRTSATSVVPYLSMDLRTGQPPVLPIVQIGHAPTQEPELARTALRDLLKSLNYADTVRVHGSAIPLRKL